MAAPARAAATQGEVSAACDAIQARGERPTLERLRTELGGGSPNAVLPLLRAWKAAQAGTAPIPPEATPTFDAALPSGLTQAIDRVQATLTGLGPIMAAALAEVAATEQRRSRLEIQAIQEAAADQVRAAQASTEEERDNSRILGDEIRDKESVIARLQPLADELPVIRADRDAKDHVIKDQAARIRQTEERVADLERKLEEGRQRHQHQVDAMAADLDSSRQRAARAEGQVEAAQGELTRLRDQVETLTASLEASRSEAAENKAALAVEHARVEHAESDLVRVRQEKDMADHAAREAADRAGTAERQAAEAQGRASAAEAAIERALKEMEAERRRAAEADQALAAVQRTTSETRRKRVEPEPS